MDPATRYEAAELDSVARFTTTLIWVLVAALVGGGAIAFGDDARPAGVILVLVGLSLALLHAWLRRLEPRAYVVEDHALSIVRRSASPRRFAGSFANPHRGRLGLRVAGDGGGYGYLGRFRAEGRTVSAYVTNRARVVLLEIGGTALAVSPDDPDRFIERIGDGT